MLLQHCITVIVILWTFSTHFMCPAATFGTQTERKLETLFAMLSCGLTNSRALASDSIRHLDLHLCGFLYLSDLLLMQPKLHSDRFCLTSFTAGVAESAGQQVLNTEPGSGHAFHSYSAFCWLHRCFRCGGDISYNNERAEVFFVLLGIALRPYFTAQLKTQNKG